MELRKTKEYWESYAKIDPLYAICSDASKKNRKWDKKTFFESGINEISTIMMYIKSLNIKIVRSSKALDFGCGVGRLTQAITPYFNQTYGIDISPTMVKLAKSYNKYSKKCTYIVLNSNKLSGFSDNDFEFVYSSIVLQHVKPKFSIEYLKEFLRILKSRGVLVFQIPDHFKYDESLSYLRTIARKLKIKQNIKKLNLKRSKNEYKAHHMYCIKEDKIRKIITNNGGKIIDVKTTNSTDGDFNGNLKFLDKEPNKGYISKQYCVVKK